MRLAKKLLVNIGDNAFVRPSVYDLAILENNLASSAILKSRNVTWIDIRNSLLCYFLADVPRIVRELISPFAISIFAARVYFIK